MDQPSALSLENPRSIVDLRTARSANIALKKKLAAEKKEDQDGPETDGKMGLGFSVLRLGSLPTGHTSTDTTASDAAEKLAVEFL